MTDETLKINEATREVIYSTVRFFQNELACLSDDEQHIAQFNLSVSVLGRCIHQRCLTEAELNDLILKHSALSINLAKEFDEMYPERLKK